MAAALRRIAGALRGFGGSYGFPEVRGAAAEVEAASVDEIVSASHTLLVVLEQIAPMPAPPQSVLIVDDDPMLALVIEAVVESIGAIAHVAGSGAEAEAA